MCGVLLGAITAGITELGAAPPLSAAPMSAPVPTPLTGELPAPAPEHVAAAEHHIDPQGEPARVVIPAIDVDVDLVRLGLQPDGAMEVPDFGLAGWYTEGPKPGHAGPAVITGHVDSRAGPDVFYGLGGLVTGDEVHVVYENGESVTFFVESSAQTPKDELPIDAIWPTTSERRLTLVTCGGAFDRATRHYLDNIVVFASFAHGGNPTVSMLLR